MVVTFTVVVVATVVGGVVVTTVVVGFNDVVVSVGEDAELPHPTSAASESAPKINRIRIFFQSSVVKSPHDRTLERRGLNFHRQIRATTYVHIL